ncbi:MAG: heme exporter protein CcmD [Betaproteobacteria bacterium]|jgi:heme exporter protein D|nr:heme exporter protein CcmD [Rhodocyclaceae bacterium]MCA3133098.1 heme exporter protein CcmD [Rhodocyclaceae bacterium]MCA3141823.1 heme exporter protein CcmD [Rhodocyclaceae bacterium]MCA3144731.1 heme exporter protein CcmD [Rhodocyclaceae bacterium]MCE2896689.1 heme exporter protein CcmD [Betaproteobacteria bacterium]
MEWGSVESFLSMGGRGAYVWGSYGVTALLLGLEAVLLVRRHRGARREPGAPGAEP